MSPLHSSWAEFWEAYSRWLERLAESGQGDLADRLSEARKCVNGLTDGWYDFLSELENAYRQSSSTLDNADRDSFRGFIGDVRRALENR